MTIADKLTGASILQAMERTDGNFWHLDIETDNGDVISICAPLGQVRAGCSIRMEAEVAKAKGAGA